MCWYICSARSNGVYIKSLTTPTFTLIDLHLYTWTNVYAVHMCAHSFPTIGGDARRSFSFSYNVM